MPFDNASLLPESLDQAVAELGLKPVSLELLEAHKAAQLRRYPAGWCYRHGVAIGVGQPLALLGGVILFALAGAAGHIECALALLCAITAGGIAPLLVRVRGPARWQERADPDLSCVHPAIRDWALLLRRHLPGVVFRLGELYQDKTRLDPYLLAEYRGDCMVLGIWDGDRLIAGAITE